MKEQQKLETLSTIRDALAKQSYLNHLDCVQNIFDKSRHNKGGSITIPKSFVEELLNNLVTEFEDLDDAKKNRHRLKARQSMLIIESILEADNKTV
jgi:hypothetical protein